MRGARLAAMTTNITKKTAVLATAVGLSLGGAALATAATSTSTPPSTSALSGTYPGGNGGGRPDETPLTGDVADKVKAAALAKVPGATVLRVETDDDGVYEAHLRKSDGTEVVAHVDKDYNVTAVDTRGAGGHGGPGGHGGHGRVDAAALAKALGVTEAKVTAALDAQHQSKDDNKGDQAAAIAKALGASATDVQSVLDAQRGAGGHGGGPGHDDGALAKALATKLGTTQAKAQAALDSVHAAHEDAEAAALAKALGVDAAKVKAALAAQHPNHP